MAEDLGAFTRKRCVVPNIVGGKPVKAPLACELLGSRILGVALTSPGLVCDFVRTRLAGVEHEVSSVLFLDNRQRVIAFEGMFRGAVNGTAVRPREVAQRSLHRNAGALILTRPPERRPAAQPG